MSIQENQENGANEENLDGVAIIGMAGRFPRAGNIYELWQNLVEGKDCITFYTDRELEEAGIAPETLKHPDYVKAKGELAGTDLFDASFFGINPREAEVTDPQHRLLLECAWEALEHAGYDPGKCDGSIGVYAGKSMDYYLLLNVYPYIRKELSAGSLQAAIGNDKDSLTTTISYRLDLRGPAVTIQTSSSTSLVAVAAACQNLLTYQCDMALAGGITAGPPIKSGYMYQEGNIWSPDGHCRAFDAGAKGFVPGCGMGLVVLKRLEEAVSDGDTIWAVIKGFAVNNDGSNKVSYSAPSVAAQVEVVTQALAAADVHPETIQYIETHGTGTNLGDPIEMTALMQTFRAYTDKKQYCAVGSLKTNIGHLDNAAGAAGLIKTALALKYGKIPPSLHFEKPNPKIDFENSPFYVNTTLKEWNRIDSRTPCRAGVTSLGMGGTNAHVIVEQAPGTGTSGPSRQWQLLYLSAKTASALETKTGDLGNYLGPQGPGKVNLADAAYTLKRGRKDFNRRRFVLCRGCEDAVASLENLTPGRVFDSVCEAVNRPVVFMFSGQGAQYVNMGRELYLNEPVFKANIDQCAEHLMPLLDIDVRELLFPARQEDIPENEEKLNQTWLTQPVLFMIEYAVARLWMDWGIQPAGMIGHSIGEYAAACVSGCMTLEDALVLVAERGRLMYRREQGAMLSVGVTESEVGGLLNGLEEELSLAAVNSPGHCVVAGTTAAVEKLQKQLSRKKVFCRRLRTSHAFHSAMMEPVMEEFARVVAKVKLNPPTIPFISGVTGTWTRDEEACDPQYWAQQLRQPVRFSDGIREVLSEPSRLLLEVGPGNSLCLLAKEHKKGEHEPTAGIFSSIRHIKQTDPDMVFLLKTVGQLWLAGAAVDWKNYYRNEKRRRIPLPTYPFERKRYWLEGETGIGIDQEEGMPLEEKRSETIAEPQTVTKTFQPRPQLNNEYVAPTNVLERSIVEIWEDILGLQPIGIRDSFFDLGGHSLLVTLFLSRLKEELGVRLELQAVFEKSTIAEIAELAAIENDKTGEIHETADQIPPVEMKEYYPVSSAQKRMFLLNRIKGGNTVSDTIPFVLEIEGKLDRQHLEKVFKLITARHEVLRTSFEMIDDTIVQRVHRDVDFNVRFLETGEDQVVDTIKEFIRPFDLGKAPLLRVQLVKLPGTRHLLMYNLHHIITDGTSMGILRRDFVYLLSGRELPGLTIQYKEFSAWQNRTLESGGIKKQEEYWLGVFPIGEEVPVLSMPLDFPRPAVQVLEGDQVTFGLTAHLSEDIKKMTLLHSGTTLHMVLLAVYNILLAKYSGQEDMIVGVPVQNRRHAHLENIMGCFVNTLALRHFPSGQKTFTQFLAEVKQNCLKAYENQEYQFEELVSRLGLKPDPGRNPLFSTMLTDVRTHEHDYEAINPYTDIGGYKETGLREHQSGEELVFRPYRYKSPVIQFDLLVYPVITKDDAVECQVLYSTALFKKETIENFGRHFINIVKEVTANPHIRISEIEMVSHKSEELLLQKEQEKLNRLEVDFNY